MRRAAFPNESPIGHAGRATWPCATLRLLASDLTGQVVDVRRHDGVGQSAPAPRRARPGERARLARPSRRTRRPGRDPARVPPRGRASCGSSAGSFSVLPATPGPGRARDGPARPAGGQPRCSSTRRSGGSARRRVRPPPRAVRLRPRGKLALRRCASSGACTSSGRRGSSSWTTPTCRSTSRRTGGATTVVQVWHADGALKRFGADTSGGLVEPERTFLHRYYDWVVTSGEAIAWRRGRRRCARPVERVLALGSPRTDFFFDAGGAGGRAGAGPGGPSRPRRPARRPLRADVPRSRAAASDRATRTRRARPCGPALPAGRTSSCLKAHPNLDPGLVPTAGFDVVVEPDGRPERAARGHRHPRHRLLVVDLRVGAAPRGRMVLLVDDLEAYEHGSRALSRLPDRDDRDAGRATRTA